MGKEVRCELTVIKGFVNHLYSQEVGDFSQKNSFFQILIIETAAKPSSEVQSMTLLLANKNLYHHGKYSENLTIDIYPCFVEFCFTSLFEVPQIPLYMYK